MGRIHARPDIASVKYLKSNWNLTSKQLPCHPMSVHAFLFAVDSLIEITVTSRGQCAMPHPMISIISLFGMPLKEH